MPLQCFDVYVPDISVALSIVPGAVTLHPWCPLNLKSTVIPSELILPLKGPLPPGTDQVPLSLLLF